jgi:hypothetical protein
MSHITFSTEIETPRFIFKFRIHESDIVDTTLMEIITKEDFHVADRMDTINRKLIPGGIIPAKSDITKSILLPMFESLRYGFGHSGTKKYWSDRETYSLESVMKSTLLNIPFYISFGDFNVSLAPERSKFIVTLIQVCILIDGVI